MATYSSQTYPDAQLNHRRARPTSLSNRHQKLYHPYKSAPAQQLQYNTHASQHHDELFRVGKYVVTKGAKITDDLYFALNVVEHKTYVTKVVQRKDCQRVLSKYKDVSRSTELPHIRETLPADDYVLLVLDLHPYFDSLPQTADLEKAQKFAKEILELVNKLHESGISPHKMSMDDFTQYKETPTSIGYHLQMMKLDGSLMLNNCDEDLPEIDACSSPELVSILSTQRNRVSSSFAESPETSNSRSKLEAFRNNGLNLEKADSWRVGAMIYTMISGRSPFPDPNTEEQKYFEAIENKQLKPPTRKISRNAWEFLLGLLEPDPEERLSITEALEHPWLQEYALRTESHGMLSSKEEHKLPSSTPSSPAY